MVLTASSKAAMACHHTVCRQVVGGSSQVRQGGRAEEGPGKAGEAVHAPIWGSEECLACASWLHAEKAALRFLSGRTPACTTLSTLSTTTVVQHLRFAPLALASFAPLAPPRCQIIKNGQARQRLHDLVPGSTRLMLAQDKLVGLVADGRVVDALALVALQKIGVG